MMGAARVVVVAIAGKRHSMDSVIVLLGHVMHGMPCRRLPRAGMRGNALHRDSRERLNRQAQCQQHDDEEFAPIRHGYGV